MTTFRAYMMAADRGTQANYDFEAPDGLLDRSPVKVVRAFFETVQDEAFPKTDLEYEINAAFTRPLPHGKVVTAMGALHLDDKKGPHLPFMVMISEKP